MSKEIKVGDIVDFYLGGNEDNHLSGMTVLKRPRGAGDTWLLEGNDGDIWEVQTFESMRLMKRGE